MSRRARSAAPVIGGFERLIKQDLGVLTMTGNQTFSAGTRSMAGDTGRRWHVTTPHGHYGQTARR